MCKMLVTYFSATGATKRLAERIANTIDADIFEIEPVVKYSEEDLKWPSRDNRTYMEMKNKRFRPLVANKLENINDYDKIFIGFPVWYYTAPTIINTFIEENNFYGKDVYIFVTSGVNSVDKSFNDLKKSYSYINFISGKRFSGSFYKKDVFDWINEYENIMV